MSSELIATYRVQLRPEFGFDQAAGIVDYLAALGVSHVYTSPVLQAAKGSTHGYDVVDHRRVNRELGGADGLARLWQTLKASGMGHVLDIVPNHMAVTGRENSWWWDVLEKGPSSRYASYFDIYWQSPGVTRRGVLSLPLLGDHPRRVLQAGEIQLAREGGSLLFRYHEHVLPVGLSSLSGLLAKAAARCDSTELASMAEALTTLSRPGTVDRAGISRRHRDAKMLRQRLARLCRARPRLAAATDEFVAQVNGDATALRELLQQQNYRLAHWRNANSKVAYRRFFDINTLVALRTEDERVFADTHELVLRWLGEGPLAGLRIDHPDGLRDPEGYLSRLRQAAPRAWIVAEKVLMPGEHLRAAWPIDGTTGYDFLNLLNGLFVDPEGEGPHTRLYADFTGEPASYRGLARKSRLLVMRELFAGDVKRLGTLFKSVCIRYDRYRDRTHRELLEALQELIACFPVYRTYVRAGADQVGEEDARYIAEAVLAAKAHRPDIAPRLLDFLRDILLLRLPDDLGAELAMRFQQLTATVMAKGVEDTAFYRFNRLVSLNEVGGDLGRFGVSVEEFHQACLDIQQHWPRTMLATSTHDTKRSEDVRARINLLSEVPEEWSRAVLRWSKLNEKHREKGLPDRNAEYLLYQTLVGAWPISVERATAYMQKAAREAKAHTSWTCPSPRYEEALRAFVDAVMSSQEFIGDLESFVSPLIKPGWTNSLAQALLKMTAPGIPDIYQGTELWDLSLVDPDNRRPVNYGQRYRFLAELDKATPEEIWERAPEGLPKLWVIRQALRLRRQRPALFEREGTYHPLIAQGEKARHVVAFARGGGVVTVVPRLILKLGGHWGNSSIELGDGLWRNWLTGDALAGGEVLVADLLRRFPVALLAREERPDG